MYNIFYTSNGAFLFSNVAYRVFLVCQQCYWSTTCSPTLFMERYMLAANVISANVV